MITLLPEVKTVTVLEIGIAAIGPVIKPRLPTGVNQLNPALHHMLVLQS